MSILYLEISLNSFLSSNNFLVDSLGLPLYEVVFYLGVFCFIRLANGPGRNLPVVGVGILLSSPTAGEGVPSLPSRLAVSCELW